MMRRVTSVLVGLTALTVAVWGLGRAFTAEDKSPHATHATSECAQACNACQRECDSCAHHCAHMLASGHKEHLKTLQTCQDCADFCAAAARIVSRAGPFMDTICKGC